jgi:hypothetical protein
MTPERCGNQAGALELQSTAGKNDSNGAVTSMTMSTLRSSVATNGEGREFRGMHTPSVPPPSVASKSASQSNNLLTSSSLPPSTAANVRNVARWLRCNFLRFSRRDREDRKRGKETALFQFDGSGSLFREPALLCFRMVMFLPRDRGFVRIAVVDC